MPDLHRAAAEGREGDVKALAAHPRVDVNAALQASHLSHVWFA